jgi:outer membrane receptor protein involved in Fe transport
MSPDDLWQTQESQLSPRASIVYHATKQLSLRTNYGRAFRAPTLAELAISQQMYASTLLGNPSLHAETLDTVELAVDYWPKDTMRLTTTGFYSLANNFIDTVFDLGSTSQFRNVGDARVAGVELEAAAQVKAINSSFDVAYQYLDAKAIDPDGAESALPYAPHHRVYARGRTNFRNTAFGELYGLYVGERTDPALGFNEDGSPLQVKLGGYFVASARVGVNVVDGLSVSLLGTNLFDNSYQEMHGFPMPERSLFAELKYVY